MLEIEIARGKDRDVIYGMRHDVYAEELGQHTPNTTGRLTDGLDERNVYFVARKGSEIAGFISVTPPGLGSYSVEKYVPREDLPLTFDDGLYEVRLLTVHPSHRGAIIAALLMYAAFRWIESHGGSQIVAIGRKEVLDNYLMLGMHPLGHTIESGRVTFELLSASVEELRQNLADRERGLRLLERSCHWSVTMPFFPVSDCYHGGAFFDAIGARFDDLDRRDEIINADVLDAWFPPAPQVVESLRAHLPWLLATSPPTQCEGMVEAIADARDVPIQSILPGAGSSDLIYLAFREWLDPDAHVLILDPTYGEYAHVLERVVGCRVDRFPLHRADNYVVQTDQLAEWLDRDYDLIALVNPNSPTGITIARPQLESLLREVDPATRVWIDETYVDYAGEEQSLERFAVTQENVMVCKSMSKAYGLSGVRAAYLCGAPHLLEALRKATPPWCVSLPAQLAAVGALASPEYYRSRYKETAVLRDEMARDLTDQLDLTCVPGVANFLLCHLPETGPTAASLVRRCRERGLYIRDVSNMGLEMGDRAVRIAVKDRETNQRMIEIVSQSM